MSGGSNAKPSGDQYTVPGAVKDKNLFRMFGSQWYEENIVPTWKSSVDLTFASQSIVYAHRTS